MRPGPTDDIRKAGSPGIREIPDRADRAFKPGRRTDPHARRQVLAKLDAILAARRD